MRTHLKCACTSATSPDSDSLLYTVYTPGSSTATSLPEKSTRAEEEEEEEEEEEADTEQTEGGAELIILEKNK